MDDDVIARGKERSVLGSEIRLMALEDVMATKLLALPEHVLRCGSRSSAPVHGRARARAAGGSHATKGG